MRMTDYLDARDEFLLTEVFAVFWEYFRSRGMPESDADQVVQRIVNEGFARGREEWARAESDDIARRLADIDLPTLSR